MLRIGTLSLPLILAAPALAQCAPRWSAYSGPMLDDGVFALSVWDPDGAGPAPPLVVAGGNFQHVGSAPLSLVGAWDGAAWRQLGSGLDGTVECLTLYDPDGAGPLGLQPVAGGAFAWDGNHHTALNGVARFDGTAWLPFGSGAGAPGGFPVIDSATTWGPLLVIGGVFTNAGGLPAEGLASWDGAAWSAFSDQAAPGPRAMTVEGGSLWAGGFWRVPGSPPPAVTGVLRMASSSWEAVGQNYPTDDVFALASYRGQLIAGGYFFNGGNSCIAAFDGAVWQPLGSGLNGTVRALCVFDPDGPGPMPEVLIAGGSFSMAGGQPASGIAAWDGARWSPLGSGASATVRALAVWNNQLVVAGEFFTAGGLTSPGMAFWGCPQAPVCYANCDASTTPPVLNVADFVCFMGQFASSDPAANCDGSTLPPTLNIADFVCFTQRFAAGCP